MGLRPIPIPLPQYALGCTILCGKISQRPDRIELRLNLLAVFTPGVTVAVFLEPQRPGQYLWSESGAK